MTGPGVRSKTGGPLGHWVDSGAQSADRQADFIAWLVADSQHRAAYRMLIRAWRRMDALLETQELRVSPPISPPLRRQRN